MALKINLMTLKVCLSYLKMLTNTFLGSIIIADTVLTQITLPHLYRLSDSQATDGNPLWYQSNPLKKGHTGTAAAAAVDTTILYFHFHSSPWSRILSSPFWKAFSKTSLRKFTKLDGSSRTQTAVRRQAVSCALPLLWGQVPKTGGRRGEMEDGRARQLLSKLPSCQDYCGIVDSQEDVLLLASPYKCFYYMDHN